MRNRKSCAAHRWAAGGAPTRRACGAAAGRSPCARRGRASYLSRRALAAGGAESCSLSLGSIRRHATDRRVEACRLLCANAACAAACVCCQTRGGAGPFGDRARQSYSPGGRYGLEQHPGRGCCASRCSAAALYTPVAGDGASTAAGILAVPDAGPAAFAAASLQLRAQRGQRPSAAEWRTMPQLRAEWWLCRHCKDAVNHNPATTAYGRSLKSTGTRAASSLSLWLLRRRRAAPATPAPS